MIKDNAPGWGDNRNLYGSQPMYLGMEKSGILIFEKKIFEV